MSLLLSYSLPSERLAGCTFAEKSTSLANLTKNGGVVSAGVVTYNNAGMRLTTTSTSLAYAYPNQNSNYAWASWSGVIEFTPEFAHTDGADHRLMTTAGTKYTLRKSAGNLLMLYSGGTAVIQLTAATYGAYWKANQRNIIAWASSTGSNTLYLNGTAFTSTTAWTPEVPVTQFSIGNTGAVGWIGTVHAVKIFTSATAGQQLTPKDCEVLSLGTTYTYWNSATCIMNGLNAQYDIANYRHLDLSNKGNHVLLGDGAGTGTPTKLTEQGYSFDGSSQYMEVPLAAWPGSAGTIIMDVSHTSTNPRLWSTSHTLGSSYITFTYTSGDILRVILGAGGSQRIANMVNPDRQHVKNVVCATWAGAGSTSLRGYENGTLTGTGNVVGDVATPDINWRLMLYSGTYTSGTVRSFMVFSQTLSAIQVDDATLFLQNLRNKV